MITPFVQTSRNSVTSRGTMGRVRCLLAGVALVLAACGSSDKPAVTSADQAVDTTIQQAGDTTPQPAIDTTQTQTAATTESSTAAVDLSAVKTFGKQTQNHVEGTVDYPQSPPVGGDHNAVWQNCGSYADPVQNEHAVHSMEHGAVWIAYRPDLAAADIKHLRDFALGQTHVLVSPYPGSTSPIVLSAWSTQLLVDSADDPRIAAFISKYQEGPQTPEPSAPCSGGTGTPL